MPDGACYTWAAIDEGLAAFGAGHKRPFQLGNFFTLFEETTHHG